MYTYFWVCGVIFNVAVIVYLLGTQVKVYSRTFIINETVTDDKRVKGIERLYANIYDFLGFGLEIATTDSEQGIKEAGNTRLFVNSDSQLGIRVLLTKKAVAYLKFYKFWKS